MIVSSTANGCWAEYTNRLLGYWGRLQTAGANQGLKAPTPALKFDSFTTKGRCILGGTDAWKHNPMGTSIEISELFEHCSNQALLIGTPPWAAVVGIQEFIAENQNSNFILKTTSYKYTLLYCVNSNADWTSSASLRVESETTPGSNSWLLNHPIHHLQPGNSSDLRFKAAEPYSLIGFVDWVLRALDSLTWAELYPELYLQMSESSGIFSFLTKVSSGIGISSESNQRLNDILFAGRADRSDWYMNLKLWNSDTLDWGKSALELTDLFRQRDLF